MRPLGDPTFHNWTLLPSVVASVAPSGLKAIEKTDVVPP